MNKLPPLYEQADIQLTKEEFEDLLELIKNPPEPTETLIRALKRAKECREIKTYNELDKIYGKPISLDRVTQIVEKENITYLTDDSGTVYASMSTEVWNKIKKAK